MEIVIREYVETDAEALWNLFFCTVRRINIRDYSQEQVEAWAPDGFDLSVWKQYMKDALPIVAQIGDVIVGYTDLQADGLIDHFFCHHEYQKQGIGKALMNCVLERAKQHGLKRCYSHVSITARAFYERFGFQVAEVKNVEIRGQHLKNFVMEKWM